MKLLKDIGEAGLIDRIRRKTKTSSRVIKGIGDDAAIIKFSRDKYLVLTCDMLVEGVHFDCSRATPYQIGWKAIGVSISDIASMGALPGQALISLGLAPGLSVKFVDQIYSGLKKLAGLFAVDLVGGDIVKSEKLVINVSMTGLVNKKDVLLRSTARPGDAILVTGRLGGVIFDKHLKFMPRLNEARFLNNNFKINSMIDISDGLIGDLGHITKESRLGAVIYQRDIPVCSNRDFKRAIEHGEDFELLFTMPKAEARKALSSFGKAFSTPISMIGEIVKNKGICLADKHGRIKSIGPKGWQHF
ncbi:MAG: thiamine-phosphate kinase [Candidatus Omnitrophota bacterium]|nr:thiamine-phosphate kinase [Candidatus Omnitrophota bacterium]